MGVRVDQAGKVTGRSLAKTSKDGPEAVLGQIERLVEKLDPDTTADRVGIGAPGTISEGTVDLAVNLAGWDRPVQVAERLQETLQRPVVIDNDVNMALYAETVLGSAQEVSNVLGVWVGTGVGGALVLDGNLRRSTRGLAGEIGHVAVVGGGNRPHLGEAAVTVAACSCGGRGHLEAYAGRAALERLARAEHSSGRPTQLVELAASSRMTSTIWVEAWANGDAVATELLQQAARATATAITAATTLIDLDAVVIGGGFASRLGSPWRRMVAEIHASQMTIGAPATITGSGIGDNAAAIGAALFARALFDER